MQGDLTFVSDVTSILFPRSQLLGRNTLRMEGELAHESQYWSILLNVSLSQRTSESI